MPELEKWLKIISCNTCLVSLASQFPSGLIEAIRTTPGLNLFIISVSGSRSCCEVLQADVQHVLNVCPDVSQILTDLLQYNKEVRFCKTLGNCGSGL